MLKLLTVSLMAVVALARNTYFDNKSKDEIKAMMGTRMDGNHMSRDHSVFSNEDVAPEVLASLPGSFDSAQKWPQCASTINYIKDQAACGSCWAVAASEVIADRTCIGCKNVLCSNKTTPYVNENKPCISISAENLMACCSYCGDGCQGGYPIDAMRYYTLAGLVTGAAYGTKCGCQPYQVNPLSHTEKPTPKCSKNCIKNYPVSFEQDKHYGTDHRQVVGEQAMMAEIYAKGPIECAFDVYENFMHYPEGNGIKDDIYWKKDGELMGGHAIKVVGWGEQNNKKYWIIHNSWNTTWGHSGVFKFRRGTNLCGMEKGCVATDPKCGNAVDNALKCIN